MSNRNEDRTLSGSTEMYVDILDLPSSINAIRIKNQFGSAGQVLAKNPTTNKFWMIIEKIKSVKKKSQIANIHLEMKMQKN